MARYKKKPLEVDAIRYGDEAGDWDNLAVVRVADFMAGRSLVAPEMCDFVRPRDGEPWDPPFPTESQIEIWDGIAHNEWLPVALGDWVVKGISGETYPVKNDIFEVTYEPV